jgi:colanic acid biosynthesis glycosyl transferase WcaI
VPSTSSHQPESLRLTTGKPARGLAPLPDHVPRARRDGRPGMNGHAAARHPVSNRHVLVVGTDETTDRGGIAAHTQGLAEHLARSAASVSMLATPTRPPTPVRTAPPPSPPTGIRIGEGAAVVRVRCHPPDAQGGWRRASDRLGFLTGALTATLPHVPDIVIGVTPGLGSAVTAARIARRHRVPLVLVVHDLVNARPNGMTGRGLTLAAATERRLSRAAEHLYDLGLRAEHVHLLPQWAPPDVEPIDQLTARRTLGWPSLPFTVVLSAAGNSRPDLATVNAAADELHREAQVVVLGLGPRRSGVPAQPSGPDLVHRAGPLDDDDHHRALVAADLLLVAERPDTTGLPLPGVVAHYLAAGRPVLAATRETGSVAGELDRTGGAGLVVRPGDPRLLAAAIRALQADQPLRLAMGQAAETYARRRLGHAEAMRQLDTMLGIALGDTMVNLADT